MPSSPHDGEDKGTTKQEEEDMTPDDSEGACNVTEVTEVSNTKSDSPVSVVPAVEEETSTAESAGSSKSSKKEKKKKKDKKKSKKSKRKPAFDDDTIGSGSSYYYNYDSDSSLSSDGSELIRGDVAKKKNRKVIAKEASRSSLLDSLSIPNGSYRKQALLSGWSESSDEDSIIGEDDDLAEFQMDLTFLNTSTAGVMNTDAASIGSGRLSARGISRTKSSSSHDGKDKSSLHFPLLAGMSRSVSSSSSKVAKDTDNKDNKDKKEKEKRKKDKGTSDTRVPSPSSDGEGKTKKDQTTDSTDDTATAMVPSDKYTNIQGDFSNDRTRQKSRSSRDLRHSSSHGSLLDDSDEEEFILFDWAAVADDTEEAEELQRHSRKLIRSESDNESTTERSTSSSINKRKKKSATDTSDDTTSRRRTPRRSKSIGDSSVGGNLEFMRKKLGSGSPHGDEDRDAPKRRSKKLKDSPPAPDLADDENESINKIRKSRKSAKDDALNDPITDINGTSKDEAPKSAKEETTNTISEDNNDQPKTKKNKKDKIAMEAEKQKDEGMDEPNCESRKSTGKDVVPDRAKEGATNAAAEEIIDQTKKTKKKNKKDKIAAEDEKLHSDLMNADPGDDVNSKTEAEAIACSLSVESSPGEKQPTMEDDADSSKPKKKVKKKDRRSIDKESIKVRKNFFDSQIQNYKDGGTPVSQEPKDESYYDWSPMKTPTKSPRKTSSKLRKTIITDATSLLLNAPPLIRAASSPVHPTSSLTLTSSVAEGSQSTDDTNPVTDNPDQPPAVIPQPEPISDQKELDIAMLDTRVQESTIVQSKSEVEELEALITYANSILKMFTDDPTQYSDAAIIALLQEFPQSASIRFTLEPSSFRGGKAKTRHYLLSLLCALGASREAIALCFDMNPDAIHKFDEWVGTPLHYAISFGITASFSREMWTDSIFDTVEYLIGKEPRLLTSQHNKKAETVLHQAILCLSPLAGPLSDGSRSPNEVRQLATLADVVVSLLLENQPLLATMPATNNILPLHLAAMHAVPTEIMHRIQKEHGQACSVRCASRGFTPLHYAAEVLGKSTVKIIDEHKQKRNGNDDVDLDLLSSRLQGHSENIQCLLTADPAAARIEDLAGHLPLHVLMRAGYSDCSTSDDTVFQTPDAFLKALLAITMAYGKAASIADSHGVTPLQFAQERKKLGDLVIGALIDVFQGACE